MPPRRIAIVAGEPSGDRLGAALVAALRECAPGVECVGMTGPAMRAAGCLSVADIGELSVMGLAEVMLAYPRLYRLRERLAAHFRATRPDVFVGIDVPDFNLGLERRLRHVGVPTVHCVCPQAWAWREGRAARLHDAADHLLALLPFEPAFFRRHGVATTFIGHPLADSLPLAPDRAAARAALGLPSSGTLVAVMPGSRGQELDRLLGLFVATASLLHGRRPRLSFAFCVAHAAQRARLAAALASAPSGLVAHCFDGRSTEVLTASDVALCASGTVTLEALLCGTPGVVAYRLSALTYPIIRRMVKIPHVALPNILAGRALVPELLQEAATPAALAAAVEAWLDDPVRQADYRAESRRLHAELRRDAARGAARVVLAAAR